MHYALIFSAAAAVLAWYAFHGAWAWLLLWPAASFALIAAAYAGLGPRVFGKRPDGQLPPWTWAALLPYLAMNRTLWYFEQWLLREPVAHEVAPGLWVGRRPRASELPKQVAVVVDLTAEFAVCEGVRDGRRYICLPALDASVPDAAAFAALVEELAGTGEVVYVHCASGHGRSACLAAAVLLRRGVARDVDEAEAMMRRVRKSIRLTRAQRTRLRQLVASMHPRGDKPSATLHGKP